MGEDRKRRDKKTETLQVRLPFGVKSRFLEACHRSGTTASDVLRSAISTYLARGERPCSETETGTSGMIISFAGRRKRVLAAGVGGAALLGVLALPSAAGPDLRAEFARNDANGDGMISFAEFSRGEVPSDEIKRARQAVREDFGKEDPRVTRQSYMVRMPPNGDQDEWRLEMGVRLSVSDWESDASGERPQIPPDDPLAYEFVNMDADSDDVVTFEEWQVHRQKVLTIGFQFLDSDADGWLSLAEFERTLRHSEFLPGHDSEGTLANARAVEDETLAASFAQLDGDRDGRVSLAEYLASI